MVLQQCITVSTCRKIKVLYSKIKQTISKTQPFPPQAPYIHIIQKNCIHEREQLEINGPSSMPYQNTESHRLEILWLWKPVRNILLPFFKYLNHHWINHQLLLFGWLVGFFFNTAKPSECYKRLCSIIRLAGNSKQGSWNYLVTFVRKNSSSIVWHNF